MFRVNTLRRLLSGLIVFGGLLLLAACAELPPNQPMNICQIYSQYPKWYWASQAAYKKWGVPPAVQMAIVNEESSFNAYAKPPRGKLLWLIPWKRPTTATGYAQATDGTWQNYIRHTGNTGADRANFADAVDFIGWYGLSAHHRLGISQDNAYQLYLAYHEGLNGYAHRTYQQQQWLLQIARKVQRISNTYQSQLVRCQKSLPKKHWWN